MREVAAAAGLSQAAVSLALRGRPGVSDATREKVEEVARQLGYRRDPRLAALSERRWQRDAAGGESIAVLIRQTVAETQAPIVEGLRQRARARGYGVEPFLLDGYEEKRLEEVLHARGIRGVVVMEGISKVLPEDWSPPDFAIVNCGVFSRRRRNHGVVANFLSSAERTCREIEQRGLRRVVFASFEDRGTIVDSGRRAAFGMIRERVGERCLPEATYLRESGPDEAFAEWVRRVGADLVVAANDFFAWKLREADVEMPGECALISLQSGGRHPWITGFRRNDREMGRSAADLLANELDRQSYGRQEAVRLIHVEAIWEQGTTL